MTCDDFFGTFSRDLFDYSNCDREESKSERGRGIGRGNNKRKVEISCQVSEFSGRRGNRKIVRRKLTKVREEEIEPSDSILNQNKVIISNGLNLSFNNSLIADAGETEDFDLFKRRHQSRATLRFGLQETASSTGRKSGFNNDRMQTGRSDTTSDDQPLRCYELFCMHQSSLLIHRNQPLVEAERLARRLGHLLGDTS